jgi:hypothetical protein
VSKISVSQLKIIHLNAEMMADRGKKANPGWWLVERENESLFDGPYENEGEALKKYDRLPGHLRG